LSPKAGVGFVEQIKQVGDRSTRKRYDRNASSNTPAAGVSEKRSDVNESRGGGGLLEGLSKSRVITAWRLAITSMFALEAGMVVSATELAGLA